MKNLRAIDLNLLVTLDSFIAECNVTRAANRLGLSQPAASNTLKRLRDLFGDELLVRSATGMTPTARAIELQKELVPILRGVERVFETRLSFDSSTSIAQFTLRMSDVLEALLLPQLMKSFLEEAPSAALNIVHLSPQDTVDALEGDRLDAAVSMELSHPSSVKSRHLFKDRMVCVMRRGHRAATKALTVKRFLAERHVRVSISPTDQRFVDNILAQMSLNRDIALQTQHWTVLAAMLRQTDLLSVMPESLARGLGSDLTLRSLPFASLPFDWKIYWHSRHDSSPGHAWVIELIARSARKNLSNFLVSAI